MQKIPHLCDLIRIQKIFNLLDFDVSYEECAELWHNYAIHEYNVDWTLLPESDADVVKAIFKYYNFSSELFNETFDETQYLKVSYSVYPVQIKKFK